MYHCNPPGRDIAYGLLYSYKGIMQILALILAFRTRHVKVKGLDDSKFAAASVYSTNIVITVMIIPTSVFRDYANVMTGIVGAGILVGTTIIIAFMFVPKVKIYMYTC